MPKSIPLSVRISVEDAEFLSHYEVPDSKTASDKLRAILKAERQRAEGANDHGAAVELVEVMMRNFRRQIRSAQRSQAMRSDLVALAYDEIPELVASMMVVPRDWSGSDENLRNFEGELLDLLFHLIEQMLNPVLLKRGSYYDSNLVSNKYASILDLIERGRATGA